MIEFQTIYGFISIAMLLKSFSWMGGDGDLEGYYTMKTVPSVEPGRSWSSRQ